MPPDSWPLYCRALLAASVGAGAELFPGRGEAAPERVHGLRKTLKEARALARLFLPSIGEPARVTIAALAAARRRVGRARDLDVMALRLKRLAAPSEIAAPLGEAIGSERAAAERAHGGFVASASRAQLRAISKRVEAWDLRSAKVDDIVRAVSRTYRQARRRGRGAFAARDDPAALHALRRRVIDLRYQLAALAPAWPAALTAQAEALDELRDTLGAFNDWRVLMAFAAEHGGLTPEGLAALSERIAARQTKLRRRALRAFERLFSETPDAFADRLSAYLRRPVEKPWTAPVKTAKAS
ncbi:MAG: CHAD domain-containing protein [Hyphomicrobiales bacterium]|nr:CHAD domain-containing protein [Hyphomicrobiales bacterium]